MIKDRILNVYRGDRILIPILTELKIDATYRAQLRLTPQSENYFTLLIEDFQIVITSEQSENLEQGTWYAELEENKDGIITTVQRTLVVIKNDVTRTYGDPAPQWETEQSVEVAEIIAKDIYFRLNNGQLLKMGTSDSYYRYTQNLPSEIWLICHGLNKRPSVIITDSAGTVVEGTVTYIDNNNLKVEFNAAFSGYAELN